MRHQTHTRSLKSHIMNNDYLFTPIMLPSQNSFGVRLEIMQCTHTTHNERDTLTLPV